MNKNKIKGHLFSVAGLFIGVVIAVFIYSLLALLYEAVCPCVNSYVGCSLSGPWYCSSGIVVLLPLILIIVICIFALRRLGKEESYAND